MSIRVVSVEEWARLKQQVRVRYEEGSHSPWPSGTVSDASWHRISISERGVDAPEGRGRHLGSA